ncbi:MAG: cyclic nucleotide-binding domain-containing protein [Verrucomicrobiota bacterium]
MNAQEERTYAKDDVIFSQDSRPDGVYIVKDGLVQIFHTIEQDGEQNEVELGRVGARGMFGEMGIIDHQPRSASARALGPTTVVFISKADFQKHINDLPPWIAILIKTFVSRLREANYRLYEVLENCNQSSQVDVQPHDEIILGKGDEDGDGAQVLRELDQ